jgi:glutathionylspermidine amidase/synthetase
MSYKLNIKSEPHRNHKLFILLSLILSLLTSTSTLALENRAACYNKCITDYGKVLGSTKKGLKAYSNCSNGCVIFEPNKYDGTYTGIKWQCVEFARRWLLANHGVVYGDVDYAIDIWDKIKFYTYVSNQEKLPVSSQVNGSKQPPVVGDLFIYAKVLLGTGHVAVVTNIDKENKKVMLAEQNYKNTLWKRNFARAVDYVIKDGSYWVLDPYLIGWKHAAFN